MPNKFNTAIFDSLFLKYINTPDNIYVFYEIRRFVKSQRVKCDIPAEYRDKVKKFGFSCFTKKGRKPRVAFVGHSYHCKTLSSSFFLAELDKFYDVDVLWSQAWKGIPDQFLSQIVNSYDNCIYWQVFPNLNYLHPQNTVIIPMWDAVSEMGSEFWRQYDRFSFLSFCKRLDCEIKKTNRNSVYLQYIPESFNSIPHKSIKEKPTIYFWQRNYDITWPKLKSKLDKNNITKIIICNATDPGFKFISPTSQDLNEYNIEVVDWCKNTIELHGRLRSCDIYVVPRYLEGIGLSMLDAISEGCVIISPDLPTMNEYIDNDIGYLTDFKNEKLGGIDLTDWYTKYEKMRERYKDYGKNKNFWLDKVMTIFKENKFC